MQKVNRFSEGYTETSNRVVLITVETSNFLLTFFMSLQTKGKSLVDRSHKPLNLEGFDSDHTQTLCGLACLSADKDFSTFACNTWNILAQNSHPSP